MICQVTTVKLQGKKNIYIEIHIYIGNTATSYPCIQVQVNRNSRLTSLWGFRGSCHELTKPQWIWLHLLPKVLMLSWSMKSQNRSITSCTCFSHLPCKSKDLFTKRSYAKHKMESEEDKDYDEVKTTDTAAPGSHSEHRFILMPSSTSPFWLP